MLRSVPIFCALFFFGCAERQAQTAVQASLTVLASGLEQADRVVEARLPGAGNLARKNVATNHSDATFDEMMSFYDQEMLPWATAVERMEEVRVVLYAAQAATSLWIASGILSEDWNRFCEVAGDQFELLMTAIDQVAPDAIPEALTNVSAIVTSVCRLAESYIRRDGE